jgi:hypothetical protein
MAQASKRQRKLNIIIDDYDQIEVASIDSFPASDPPGWIEAKAHPCVEADTPGKKEWPKKTSRGAKRAASR